MTLTGRVIDPRLPPLLPFAFFPLCARIFCNVETLQSFQTADIYFEAWYVRFMCFRFDCNAFNTAVKRRHLWNLQTVGVKCVLQRLLWSIQYVKYTAVSNYKLLCYLDFIVHTFLLHAFNRKPKIDTLTDV